MTTSLFSGDVTTTTACVSIGHLIHNHKEGSVFFDETYQRKYVWGTKEQQQLLKTIFKNLPIDAISVVINDPSSHKYIEVIDGLQRCTTLIKFTNDEFPYITETGAEVYHSQMSDEDKREFRSIRLPMVELSSNKGSVPITLEQKVAYFYRKNFYGVPQSSSHKAKIENMISQLGVEV
ncbi:DUF262 domain-containing protein [Photobacterium kishitanii]|uniref:GmrSD restriction endonucleases N-terminal domain-containing protein n=1 Tax=Photobacterium kishitanii TaxID=318456 RepID=A0A2T3KKY1_9GAMM|nr:DUF262 domain-containing protein [Photobacterium kishitanii]PSV00378.1 hypothetical protein C9J27_04420 [Photobacterium kishitanii]